MTSKRKIRRFATKGTILFMVFCFGIYSVFPYPAVLIVRAEDQQPSEPANSNDSIQGTDQEGQVAANSDTGADSASTSETNINNETNVTNENNAITYNNSYLKSETGNNQASFNTGSGVVTTQKAEGRGELVNLINDNIVNVEPDNPESVNVANENTGANSNNEAKINITNETVIKNINNSDTINKLEADVISGKNDASYNTSHGIILSGQANLGLNFLSLANTNFTGVENLYADAQNVFGNHRGNVDFSQTALSTPQLATALIEASNKSTGAGSSNTATVDINDETTIINVNNGKIRNEIIANVISGQNKANHNTGTGSIGTGDVKSSVNVLNFLNANITASNFWLKSLNVFGDWSGSINLPKMPLPNLSISSYQEGILGSNSKTGPGSENEADVSVNNEFTQTNKNEANISNSLSVKANTGSNQTSYNNFSGIVRYGNAKAEANVANLADVNITGDSWWILIVNKFGNWLGTTVGSPSDMEVQTGLDSTILSPRYAGVKVFNDSTGPDSNNSAGATINHSTEISNANSAIIENNISVAAITGENEAQYNVGHGYVDAGDIESIINAVNIANVNVNVGNMLIGVINVFGDWSGNIVFNSGSVLQNNIFSQTQGDGSTAFSSSGNTGSGSDNQASADLSTEVNIENTNDSENINNSSTSSSSGQNEANYNTGSGIVSTGSADTLSSIVNQSNNNEVNVGQIDCNNIGASNLGTGADSENNSTASLDCNIDINSNNATENNNNLIINNSTGNNEASYNTGDGKVDTSWVDTFVQLYNKTNNNQITVGEIEGVVDGGEGSNNEGDNNGGGGDNGGGDSGNNNSDEGDSSSGNNGNNNNDGNSNNGENSNSNDSGGSASNNNEGSDSGAPGDNSESSADSQDNSEGNNNSGNNNENNNSSGANSNNSNGNNTSGNNSNASSQNSSSNANPTNSDSASSSNSNGSSGGAGGGGGGSGGGGGGGGGGIVPSINSVPSNNIAPSNVVPTKLAVQGTCLSNKPKGDINCDGKIDIYDLSFLMSNWGKRFKDKKSDINKDGKVDYYELSVIMSNWTKKSLAGSGQAKS